ncbi:MAG: hypothetical protein JST86_20720 [Bacteroidetes bacterium]|nr:hypothetical protein [Bacteroidota bacterium]
MLKKRFEINKIKDVSITANNVKKEISVLAPLLDEETISQYLLRKGSLVFYESYGADELAGMLSAADKQVHEQLTKQGSVPAPNPLLSIFAQFYNQDRYNNGYGLIGAVNFSDTIKLKEYLAMAVNVFPLDNIFLFKKIDLKTNKKNISYCELYAAKSNYAAFVANDYIKSVNLDYDYAGNPGVNIKFDPYGRIAFAKMTERNIGKSLIIAIDNTVLSAPVVQSTISDGNCVIGGNFTALEAVDLVNIMQSGYFPLHLKVKELNIAAEEK